MLKEKGEDGGGKKAATAAAAAGAVPIRHGSTALLKNETFCGR
jgi:hypothetical protein